MRPQIIAVSSDHHQCLNFEDMEEWARGRAVTVWEDGVPVRPGKVESESELEDEAVRVREQSKIIQSRES